MKRTSSPQMFKRAFALAVSRVHPRAALVQAARPYHHPAAEIDHGASIGAGVSIGPFCVVSSRAVIGPNCELGPGVHVLGNTTLGAGCVLHSHAVIGADTESEGVGTTVLGDGVKIFTGAVVHSTASIGPGCVIGAGTTVGPGVSVGAHTRTGDNVVLTHCDVGERCTLHHGVKIGQDGFGFHHGPDGDVVKRSQERRVVVGDDVEIGANSCLDRGSWRDTVVGNGSKIDNLCQIGHNVIIGRACILCGHVALGGSATIGDRVILAGKSAVSDHTAVCSDVRVGARSGVISDITTPGDYAGWPAIPAAQWRRQRTHLKRLGLRHFATAISCSAGGM